MCIQRYEHGFVTSMPGLIIIDGQGVSVRTGLGLPVVEML